VCLKVCTLYELDPTAVQYRESFAQRDGILCIASSLEVSRGGLFPSR
jgi:hypothetical protein